MKSFATDLSFASMKNHLIVLAIGLFLVVQAEEKYTTKYDNIDIDAIISSERLLKAYVNCLLDRGSCTADAAELKKNLPDALEHDCSACSEAQKKASDKVSQYLIDNRPDEWSLLEQKYDPTGIYRKRYLEMKSKQQMID